MSAVTRLTLEASHAPFPEHEFNDEIWIRFWRSAYNGRFLGEADRPEGVFFVAGKPRRSKEARCAG